MDLRCARTTFRLDQTRLARALTLAVRLRNVLTAPAAQRFQRSPDTTAR
jgi:hypothetical protein